MTEKKDKSINRQAEDAIINLGLYVPAPINLNCLLTQNERDVLNIIRHLNVMNQPYISLSLLRLETGMDKRIIQKARDSLIKLELISIESETKYGTRFIINYDKLCEILEKLNNEKNPINRFNIANDFRKDNKNTKLIEEFTNTEFNPDRNKTNENQTDSNKEKIN